MSQLFRQEVIERNEQRLLGTISLAQPVSIYLWVGGAMLIFVLLMALLLMTEVHRKENVHGFLVPDKGLIKVRTHQAGVIAKVHVNEGDTINSGDKLVTIWNHRTNGMGRQLSESLTSKIKARIKSTRSQQTDNAVLLVAELESNAQLLVSLQQQASQLDRQSSLSEQRLEIQLARLEKQRLLSEKGHVPKATVARAEEVYLSEQLAFGQLQQQILMVQRDRRLALSKAEQLPVQRNIQHENSERLIAELEQRLSEVESSFEFVVAANQEGVVTALQVVEGQSVSALSSLLTIIPTGSNLVAELLVPTRSAGLVAVGDSAQLRFDAFPYQHFGMLAAEVLQVDRALLTPDATDPFGAREPVYRIRASLNAQQLVNQGRSYSLQAGMQVEADLLQEKRQLLDWVLEPITGFKR